MLDKVLAYETPCSVGEIGENIARKEDCQKKSKLLYMWSPVTQKLAVDARYFL
jgi:hypothetical protein